MRELALVLWIVGDVLLLYVAYRLWRRGRRPSIPSGAWGTAKCYPQGRVVEFILTALERWQEQYGWKVLSERIHEYVLESEHGGDFPVSGFPTLKAVIEDFKLFLENYQ